MLAQLHRLHPEGGYDREALAVVSRTQSRFVTEMLREADVSALTGNPAFVALRDRRGALNTALADLRRAQILSGRDGFAADEDEAQPEASPSARLRSARRPRRQLAARMTSVRADLAAVESGLWREFPRYMELTQPKPVTVALLQEDAAAPPMRCCFATTCCTIASSSFSSIACASRRHRHARPRRHQPDGA